MQLHVNFTSAKPVYLQLIDQVKAAAASGQVGAGEPLPAIRQLAEQLRVNRNTVAKAYGLLESQGIIETVPGKGCFVCHSGSPLKKAIRLELVTREIDEAVVQAHQLQVDKSEFLRLTEQRFDAFQAGRDRAAS